LHLFVFVLGVWFVGNLWDFWVFGFLWDLRGICVNLGFPWYFAVFWCFFWIFGGVWGWYNTDFCVFSFWDAVILGFSLVFWFYVCFVLCLWVCFRLSCDCGLFYLLCWLGFMVFSLMCFFRSYCIICVLFVACVFGYCFGWLLIVYGCCYLIAGWVCWFAFDLCMVNSVAISVYIFAWPMFVVCF